jgi:23S rRNA (guanosine2251-2'-O)-methyltransferase
MISKSAELVVYGKQPVKEALLSGHAINRLIIGREIPAKENNFYRQLAEKRNIKVEIIAKGQIQRYCGPVLHQGVAAIMGAYQYAEELRLMELIDRSKMPLLIVLDQIQDPHNLGAILRTAEAAGVTAVIIPEKGSAEITATVAKTSAGAVFHIPVHRTENLFTLTGKLKARGIALIALAPGKQEIIYRFNLNCPVALVIGSEGKGVRKNLQNLCDHTLSIPQRGRTGSLNASVSAALIIFETVRQRIFAVKEN